MPKKTRQEKILARLRRLEGSQTRVEGVQPTIEQLPEGPKVSFVLKPKTSQPTTATSADVVDYSYVYKDLTKSLIFAAVAVTLQVLLALFVFN